MDPLTSFPWRLQWVEKQSGGIRETIHNEMKQAKRGKLHVGNRKDQATPGKRHSGRKGEATAVSRPKAKSTATNCCCNPIFCPKCVPSAFHKERSFQGVHLHRTDFPVLSSKGVLESRADIRLRVLPYVHFNLASLLRSTPKYGFVVPSGWPPLLPMTLDVE